MNPKQFGMDKSEDGMNYQDALKESRIVGAANAQGLPHLAQVVFALSSVHAINPELAYNGAVRNGLYGEQVRKLGPVELGDLMFVD